MYKGCGNISILQKEEQYQDAIESATRKTGGSAHGMNGGGMNGGLGGDCVSYSLHLAFSQPFPRKLALSGLKHALHGCCHSAAPYGSLAARPHPPFHTFADFSRSVFFLFCSCSVLYFFCFDCFMHTGKNLAYICLRLIQIFRHLRNCFSFLEPF